MASLSKGFLSWLSLTIKRPGFPQELTSALFNADILQHVFLFQPLHEN
jgi:hypothetical protein